ncbi:TetR/AcrR family transcriptional regulator [Rhizobium calliandrae]|uniref:TetR/AcrR family transcriptional regulator n=1 Tax=Rhizobium calliandrae TaxID=1312182 RepID=A0ABT7KRT4_9HYPH|nr:TetR/AcrR family transcriptional regulator [Rhizobium calliandrae]MDL2410778.1 TetR/AcrR family transcriptional regulator [Rhizobium calliandrae]
MRASSSIGTGRPRSPEVDAAILDAALALFIEGGLSAVSFEQITQRSGVSRTAIYRRWSSREEILARALGHLCEEAEATFADWAERPISEVMDWFVENVPRQMLNPLYRGLSRSVLALGEKSELKAIYSEAVLRPRRAAFSNMIRRARATGALPSSLDPELIQDMLIGALLHQILLEPADQTEEQLRDYIIRLLTGLGLLQK